MSICLFVCLGRYYVSSHIPLVRMSLLMLALTDKCFKLWDQTAQQVIQTLNTLPCENLM